MNENVEIIQFKLSSLSNLYVTGIPGCLAEYELNEKLGKIFSSYGLLYEIQVFPVLKISSDLDAYYAFVKFYSEKAAQKAVSSLDGKLMIKGRLLKVRYASRKKHFNADQYRIDLIKCEELAAHYLGFNGWSCDIISLDDSGGGGNTHMEYFCVVKLIITGQAVHSEGFGAWREAWNPADLSTTLKDLCKCKKFAYKRAMEDAFAKVVIVVIDGTRVQVEINTTGTGLPDGKEVEMSEMLKVSEVEEVTQESDSDSGHDNMDEINEQILHNLADEGCKLSI